MPGTFRPLANKDNDYLMDRAAQKRGDTCSGIAIQDGSLQESMGPIVDRTKENLHRQRHHHGAIALMRAARDLAKKGTPPPGLDVAHQAALHPGYKCAPKSPAAGAALTMFSRCA